MITVLFVNHFVQNSSFPLPPAMTAVRAVQKLLYFVKQFLYFVRLAFVLTIHRSEQQLRRIRTYTASIDPETNVVMVRIR